jgi:hypothetical protein
VPLTAPEVGFGPREFIPTPVQREADLMSRRTGADPLIEHESPTVIRISHESGPLRVEVVYRHGSRGWQQSDCRLLHHGEQLKCTDIWAKYTALAEKLPQGADGSARLPDPAPLGQDELPIEVHNSLAVLRRRLGGRSDVVGRIGQDGKGRYVLVVESSKATVHMLFEPERRHGRKSARPAEVDPIRVVPADGTSPRTSTAS